LQIQVDGPEGRPVEVRLQERDGNLRLAVHTQDPEFNEALRGRVDELLKGLEAEGLYTDAAIDSVSEVLPTEPAHDSEHRGSQGAFENPSSGQQAESGNKGRRDGQPHRQSEGLGKRPASGPSFSAQLAEIHLSIRTE
jgi:hypothetical protein